MDALTELIEGPENFEKVGQAIAEILAINFTHQQTLAIDDNKDPTPYEVEVYDESTRPWEGLRGGRTNAVLNVTFEQDDDMVGRGDPVRQQTFTGRYNVDIITKSNTNDAAGDSRAAFKAQQLAGFARRIIMAGAYTYLGLRGIVSRRRVVNRQMLAAPKADQLYDFVVCRLVVEVDYKEESPQVQAVTLEGVDLKVRDEDGQVVVG